MAFPPSMIVLAAGASQRAGSENKLLLPFDGHTILESTVLSLLAADAEEVIVVTGHDAARLEPLLSGLPVRIVRNAGYRKGMSTSIRLGVSAARGAVGICLADMPFIKPATIRRLIAASELHRESIVVPVFEGVSGHPVLFSDCFREELLRLEGDRGARDVIHRNEAAVIEVETADPGILRDIDTLNDYEAARASFRRST